MQKRPITPTILTKAANIRLVVFDVDGVLTDGKLDYTEEGRECKAFYSQDGVGMKQLLKQGLEVAIISGRRSSIVKHRMAELGVRHVFQGQQDKTLAFNALLQQLQLTHQQTAYVGDDLPDLAVMQQAGLSIAVANAVDSIVKIADYQTQAAGGAGAAREACELILTATQSSTNPP